jgi:small GTP-binding protein
MRILNDRQQDILNDERKSLNDLLLTLVKFEAIPDDTQTLTESIAQLDDLFLLVVVGEFNSGKSAFINALIGQQLLKEGVTPTTTQINILRYGPTQDRTVVNEIQHVLSLPIDLLAEISIVDTPGTNAIIRSHETITTQFVPRSDLVLFITSADRPFTESERAFLESIHDWGKKVVIVINKIDILESEDDLVQIEQFVARNALHLLDLTPEIFPVSSRMAIRSKQGERELWNKSRFEPLESYIRKTLDEKSRLRLKLLNPLGVGMHLVERYAKITASRLDLLKEDTDTIADVEAQLALYQEDMHRDFNFRMSDVENILYEMEQRGQDYFDETFRLARVFDLLSKDRISQEFERRVVADAPQLIDKKVNEIIDWLVDSDFRQWQAVNDHLAERRRTHQGRIVGEENIGSFSYDRERLIDAVGRESQRVIETYDKAQEAEAIAEGAQLAVAASAALEISAVGLGTLVAIIATTAAADITGVLLASTVAVLGLFVIPARRRAAKSEMREKVATLRDSLVKTLRAQFEREIARSMNNIDAAIAPYTRFVRSEHTKLHSMQENLEKQKSDLSRIKALIDEL